MTFGTLPDGRTVDRITISNGDLSVSILTYGAIVQDVRLKGHDHNLTLGSDDINDYLGAMKHYGPIIAPVGNRIKGARATFGGIEHMLTPNEGHNILHSAEGGSQFKLWTVEDQTPDTVTLTVLCADGEAGFPGNQRVMAHFAILPDNVMRMEITATTDELSMINICNHSYWNLTGNPTFAGHKLQIKAQNYLPTDAENIPTEVTEVEGTDYDFRTLRDVVPANPPIDHNFCLSRIKLDLRDVVTLEGGDLRMTIATDMPGLQVYDGRSASNAGFANYAALAFEPQFWPNAPHEPTFPKITVKAGEVWTQEVEWRFNRLAK